MYKELLERDMWRERWQQLMRDHEKVIQERDRAEALLTEIRVLAYAAQLVPVHVGGGNLVDNRRMVLASDVLEILGEN